VSREQKFKKFYDI